MDRGRWDMPHWGAANPGARRGAPSEVLQHRSGVMRGKSVFSGRWPVPVQGAYSFLDGQGALAQRVAHFQPSASRR